MNSERFINIKKAEASSMEEQNKQEQEQSLSEEDIDQMYSNIYKLISDLLSATEENTAVQKRILTKIDQLLEIEESSSNALKKIERRF